jgi:predicted nucleotide-binding protein
MKVAELAKALEDFRSGLAAHERLFNQVPDRRMKDEWQTTLEGQSAQLSRRHGALRPYIERFDNQWLMQHPATGVTWDALEAAISVTGHPSKRPSMRAVIQKLDQILGNLETLAPDVEIPADRNKPIRVGLPTEGVSMLPMSIEHRRHILAATSILKALGHTGFDQMLLELGVPEDVGTGSGLAARANSFARYILGNPDAKAVDGTLVGDAIIKRARSLVERGMDGSSNVTSQERDEYHDAVADDVEEGQKVPPSSVKGSSEISVSTPVSGSPQVAVSRKKPRRKVFIVHGHDVGPREAVARILERLDFEPIILHEQPNRGRTIITKFQEEAADVGFAVVLMTPDDIGGKQGESSDPLRARARQNVIFELGFFIGVLGPERVAALVKGTIERPSDFDGVVYVNMDEQGGWMRTLARELNAAGFEVDLNKLP